MIEKHSSTQSAALSDLQNELRSLKALLQSRTQPPASYNPPAHAPSGPTQAAPQDGSSSMASSTGSLSSASGAAGGAGVASGTGGASGAGGSGGSGGASGTSGFGIAGQAPAAGNVSSTTAAANALLGVPKGRGIPAWQKAAGSGSGSPGGSRSGTPVTEEKKDESAASAAAAA